VFVKHTLKQNPLTKHGTWQNKQGSKPFVPIFFTQPDRVDLKFLVRPQTEPKILV